MFYFVCESWKQIKLEVSMKVFYEETVDDDEFIVFKHEGLHWMIHLDTWLVECRMVTV